MGEILQDGLYNKTSLLIDQIELRTQLNQLEMFVEH